MPDLPADDVGKPSPEVPEEQSPAPQEGASTPPPAQTPSPGAGRGLDWRLVVIVGVAVLFLIAAYANRAWYGKQRGVLPPAQQPAPSAPGAETRRPPVSLAEAYAGIASAREFEAEGATYTAPGGKVMVLALPSMPVAGKENPGQVQNVAPGKVFDITHRVEGLKPEMLQRRPVFYGANEFQIAYMDTFPPLGFDKGLQMDVKAASEVKADPQADAQPVVGVKVGTEARAYPLRMMNYHDVINDTLGGAPIVVVWSAWANAASAMFRAPADHAQGRPEANRMGGDAAEQPARPGSPGNPSAETDILTFGSAGLMFQSANVIYDTKTSSLWSATERLCIAGELVGDRLKPLEAMVTTLQSWKTLNPGTTVLVGTKPPLQGVNYDANPATPGDYLVPTNPFFQYPSYGDDITKSPLWIKARVFGVTGPDGKAAKAYLIALLLETKGPFEDTMGGQKATLQYDPATRWLSAKDADGKPLLTEAMLWVAWFGAHPKSEVWQEEKIRNLGKPGGSAAGSMLPAKPQAVPGVTLPPEEAPLPPGSIERGKPAPAADTGPAGGAR